jgi:hypothetical protein
MPGGPRVHPVASEVMTQFHDLVTLRTVAQRRLYVVNPNDDAMSGREAWRGQQSPPTSVRAPSAPDDHPINTQEQKRAQDRDQPRPEAKEATDCPDPDR